MFLNTGNFLITGYNRSSPPETVLQDYDVCIHHCSCCPRLPAQQQFGVVLALQVTVDEVRQQVFQHVGGVLQPPLQGRHDQGGHVAAVPHGEGALHLQGSYEGEQEDFVIDELAKDLQGLLHVLLAISGNLNQRRLNECCDKPTNCLDANRLFDTIK